MLKKSMAAVVMVMVFALALAGCGGSDGVMSISIFKTFVMKSL